MLFLLDLSDLHVVNIGRMAESENKTVHFQYKIACINTNATVIGITHLIIIRVIIDFIHSHRHVRRQRFYKKNKFELDRPDHDSQANRAECYLL